MPLILLNDPGEVLRDATQTHRLGEMILDGGAALGYTYTHTHTTIIVAYSADYVRV